MEHAIVFTTTPPACRICDQWDPLRRTCKRGACRFDAATYSRRAKAAAKADERRAAHG